MSTITAGRAADTDKSRFLRLALRVDAIASGAVGAGLLALNGVLVDLMNVPTAVSIPVGVFLLGWAAAIWLGATKSTPRFGRGVMVINEVWVALSVAYLLLADLTTLGVAFVLLQAIAVLAFALAQWRLSGA